VWWVETFHLSSGISFVIVMAFLVFAVISSFDWFPVFVAWWTKGSTANESFRNLSLMLAAPVGIGLAVWRSILVADQARTAQQGHITDRFSAAVEHLGSKELPVRLGGIYALWRLADDSAARDEKAVWDILCAFIRHPPHEPEKVAEKNEAANQRPVRPDIQTILDLLATATAASRRKAAGYRLDLNNSRLYHAILSLAKLPGADLYGAILSGADLSSAELYGADLTGAYLTDADLTDADLSGANLSSAELSGAELSQAKNLTQAQLDAACISKGRKKPTLPKGLNPPTKIFQE